MKCSCTHLSFALWIVAKLLCSCLRLLDAIVELHAMVEKMFNDFFYWKVKVGFTCNKCFCNPRFMFCIYLGFNYYITLNSSI